jgi:hypothetical protein
MRRAICFLVILACIAYGAWRVIDNTAQHMRAHDAAQLSASMGGDA